MQYYSAGCETHSFQLPDDSSLSGFFLLTSSLVQFTKFEAKEISEMSSQDETVIRFCLGKL